MGSLWASTCRGHDASCHWWNLVKHPSVAFQGLTEPIGRPEARGSRPRWGLELPGQPPFDEDIRGCVGGPLRPIFPEIRAYLSLWRSDIRQTTRSALLPSPPGDQFRKQMQSPVLWNCTLSAWQDTDALRIWRKRWHDLSNHREQSEPVVVRMPFARKWCSDAQSVGCFCKLSRRTFRVGRPGSCKGASI